jgi:transposase
VGVRANQVYNWKQRISEASSGERLMGEDREELLKLRKEVKKLRIEKEILKKASAYFAKEMK